MDTDAVSSLHIGDEPSLYSDTSAAAIVRRATGPQRASRALRRSVDLATGGKTGAP
jgi:hypothetical protein